MLRTRLSPARPAGKEAGAPQFDLISGRGGSGEGSGRAGGGFIPFFTTCGVTMM